MTRILLTLASLLLLVGTARAQYGIRAGANFATFNTNQSSERRDASSNGRLGYQVGVFYEKPLTRRLSLVPEGQYSRQSMDLQVEDYSISDGSYTADYRLKLHYLHVPVVIRAAFGKFYVEAGPQGSFLLATHEEGTEAIGSVGGTYERGFDRPATDSYRRFDVGVCAGVGVKLSTGLALVVRTSAGFISLTDFGKIASNYKGHLRNQVVQASLSYQFKHKS